MKNDELMSLAVGPSKVVHRYGTYIVNGFRFHTKDRSLPRKTQNSGVLVRGDDENTEKEYYGVLEDILELSYVGNRKVYLFRCHWWDVARLGRGYKIDNYGFTSVNIHGSLNTNEPYVLASQAEQVFYVENIVEKDWLFVVKTTPRDLYNMPHVEDNNADDGDDDSCVDKEDAYQEIEIEDDNPHNYIINNDINVVLHRDDIEPERIRCERDQLVRDHNRQDDFINDNDLDEDLSDESNEDFLDSETSNQDDST